MIPTTRLFQKGDKVYLKTTHIKTKRQSKKLDTKKLRSFKIIRDVKDMSFELKLPKGMRIHPIFHASKLKQCHQDISLQTESTSIESEQEYEVENILKHNESKKNRRYLVC